MSLLRLTDFPPAATSIAMLWDGTKEGRSGQCARRARAIVMGVAATMMTAGCISVNAPDKPIVIELNINIKQEVIYRLAEDATNTIQSNPDIF
jgi:hypothetical protein